jgi:hypothetical protein
MQREQGKIAVIALSAATSSSPARAHSADPTLGGTLDA